MSKSRDLGEFPAAALDIDASGNLDVTGTVTADGFQTNTLGTSNFRAGVNAGNSIIAGGNHNTLVGDEAGTAITTASSNTAVGREALTTNTTGADNAALGRRSLNFNTTGSNNVALGLQALYSNTTASNNTAVGASALFANTTGTSNVAVGTSAGAEITTGEQNTFIGVSAGDALTNANFNVAVGTNALGADTLGSHSIAIGRGALELQNFTIATDAYNTAVGSRAGRLVTTGKDNTFIGGVAGDATTTADNTTVVGSKAGRGLTTGPNNVFLGTAAGTHLTPITTGSENTLLGSYTNAPATAAAVVAIGHAVTGASGYTTIGYSTSDIRAAHGTPTWATVSDQRYKKDIVDSTAGLTFVNALRPRTFKYKTLGELPETFSAYEADSTKVFKNTKTNHGFIAQEVKAAIDADSGIADGFKLWDEREDGSQEVAEAALIPVLVKAIQEQTAVIAALTARIETLEG